MQALLPIALATLALVQVSEVAPPSLLDRMVEVRLPGEGAPLAAGFGAGQAVVYEVTFDGTLHIWATSEAICALQVDSEQPISGKPSASTPSAPHPDGLVPYVARAVRPGDSIEARVAVSAGAEATVRVHFAASPESDETREATALAEYTRTEVRALVDGGDAAGAREWLANVIEELCGMEGAAASDSVATAVGELAVDALQAGDERLALRARRFLLAARRRCYPPGHPALLNAMQHTADSLWATGDLDAALEMRESVLDAQQRILPEDDPALADARRELARSLWRNGNIGRARAIQETALAALERRLPADDPAVLSERSLLAVLLDDAGELLAARDLREAILETAEKVLPPDDPQLVNARTNLAISLNKLGELERARALQEKVVAHYERILPAHHTDLVGARANLAISLSDMGDAAAARALEEDIVAAYERNLPDGHPLLIGARFNLSVSMSRMGDYTAARALQETLLATAQESLPPGHADLLRFRTNLAATMFRMEEYDAARDLLEATLEAFAPESVDDQPLVLQVQSSLASVYWHLGELASARDLLAVTLEAQERVLAPAHPLLWSTRAALATALEGTGDEQGALALRREVLEFQETALPADDPILLGVRAELAAALANADDDEATEQLSLLVDGMQQRVLDALALAPRQATQVVASEERRLTLVLRLAEGRGDELLCRGFELLETMRLVSGEAARFLSRFEEDPELAPILERAASLRGEVNDAVEAGLDAGRDAERRISELALERDRLERQAARLLSERGIVATGVDRTALAATLAADEAAVAYCRVGSVRRPDSSGGSEGSRFLAWVLRSDGALARLDLGPARELEELLADWTTALGRPSGSRHVSVYVPEKAGGEAEVITGTLLRRRLLDPVLAAAGESVTKLQVCGDDLTYLVPLDALPLANARLGDRYRVVHSSSFSNLLSQRPARPDSERLLAVGAAKFDAPGLGLDVVGAASAPIELGRSSTRQPRPASTFQPIPFAAEEVEAIGQLHARTFSEEATVLTGAEATKAALFRHAPGAAYLHIATHGWFAPDRVRSLGDPNEDAGFARLGLAERVTGFAPMTLCGLALAGANAGRNSLGRVPGILTAEELCTLDLSQCELAVLSACETNLGMRRAGQGIESLQSALHAAGAHSSITSVWKVSDSATRKLMELFYKGLWEDGFTKADALWSAKSQMRAAGAPVSDWGAWVLTGDPE